jgi:uncharacterized membrane protein YkoI
MNKKRFVIPAILIAAIGGGAVLAQTDIFAKANANPAISAQQAKDIALKELNGQIVDFEYDGDDFTPHYEIEVVKDGEKVEYKIDAKNGDVKVKEREIVSTSQTETVPESTTAKMITEEEAIKIATDKASGTLVSVELDKDDQQVAYEIEIRNGKTEYEFNIDAYTGAILKYEEDLED